MCWCSFCVGVVKSLFCVGVVKSLVTSLFCVGVVKSLFCVGVVQLHSLCSGVELSEYLIGEEEVLRTLNAVSAVKKQVERVRLHDRSRFFCCVTPSIRRTPMRCLLYRHLLTAVLVSGGNSRGGEP